MPPTGAPDPLYVRARRVLLDALEALGPHRASVVLVGAQAVYLHTGDGDLAVAPYTTDGDLAVDPRTLAADPRLTEAMAHGGFVATDQPGHWIRDAVAVDLMVPEALAGPGARGARLGIHGNRVARRARGLEPALVDNTQIEVASLDSRDTRAFGAPVAGPAALLVSKLIKISERVGDRSRNKDALDVFRLLRATTTDQVAGNLRKLRDDRLAGPVTVEAIGQLRTLFASAAARGNLMLAAAVAPLEDEVVVRESCAALVQDMLAAL